MELELYDFERAAERLKPILHHTELDLSSTFSRATGGQIYLKCENRQKTGFVKSKAQAGQKSTCDNKQKFHLNFSANQTFLISAVTVLPVRYEREPIPFSNVSLYE